MKKRTIYPAQSQELLTLFEQAGTSTKVLFDKNRLLSLLDVSVRQSPRMPPPSFKDMLNKYSILRTNT